eukprot:TRINITY_DN74406_c0_g1_i1.p1 TRINITY_DN74406_c0_g1~~TRINITY_DN74406_c0_g1_i1.p1  ORF type:complete len:326 (-),score=158.52 TRINITY_DN74406_c0_g1_i1:108-1085(-)
MSDKSGSGSEPEEDYEVQDIRDKRRGEDGEWLYYVKWVGWESDTNTWEPVEHLDECKEKLLDFERRWRRKQEKKEQRRREEREHKLKERRERELKNAARLKVEGGDDGGYGQERKKEKKKIVSESSSDSEGEKKKKDKDREREREKSKKHKRDKERKREGGDLFKADGQSSKKKEEALKKESKPKYFRDVKPEKILGVTSDLGEVHFYIKWEGGKAEPGLVTAKEAYQKIPQMCLKFYESHLVWDKKEAKKGEKDATLTKEKVTVPEKVVRRESVESKSSETSKGEAKERPSSSLSKGEPSQEVPPPPPTNPDFVVATSQPTPVE